MALRCLGTQDIDFEIVCMCMCTCEQLLAHMCSCSECWPLPQAALRTGQVGNSSQWRCQGIRTYSQHNTTGKSTADKWAHSDSVTRWVVFHESSLMWMQPLLPSMPQVWSLMCPGPSERLWHYAYLAIYFCRPCENKTRQPQGTVRMIFPSLCFPGWLCSASLGLWSFWDQLRGNWVRPVSIG